MTEAAVGWSQRCRSSSLMRRQRRHCHRSHRPLPHSTITAIAAVDVVVECAAAAMVVIVVVDGGGEGRGARGEVDTGEGGRGHEGEGEASEGKRARADEGAWARAMVDMADDNGKQQKGASDNGAACGVALK